MTEPEFGWGIQRPEASTGKPFLLGHFFSRKREAIDFLFKTYGERPNRKAALKRHTREGIFVVRVKMARAFEEVPK